MMRRLGRRGDLNYFLSRLIDIIWSLIVVFLILVIAFTLWKVFYAADKQALNQYRLMGDLTEGLLQSPEGTVRQFTLSADLKEERETFKGTILARSSDGLLTTPIPPTIWWPGAEPAQYVDAAKLNAYAQAHPESLRKMNKACGGNAMACLCFSKTVLSGVNDIPAALNRIAECRSFARDGDVVLDFASLQPQGELGGGLLGSGLLASHQYYVEGSYPVVELKRGACGPLLARNHPSLSEERTVCVYAAVRPKETTQ